MTEVETPIRNASTIILVRDAATHPRILMGQRGSKAVFMPSKFVFPGGAVDDTDELVAPSQAISATCDTRLTLEPHIPVTPRALAMAAIRELWEETGLRLARPAAWDISTLPQDWHGFSDGTLAPDAEPLSYFFRAITPPGRPRRFDARFFLADAGGVIDDLDDFSRATEELSHLQWIDVHEAKAFDLPFITEVVLSELIAHLPNLGPPERVPFYDNRSAKGVFIQL